MMSSSAEIKKWPKVCQLLPSSIYYHNYWCKCTHFLVFNDYANLTHCVNKVMYAFLLYVVLLGQWHNTNNYTSDSWDIIVKKYVNISA